MVQELQLVLSQEWRR